MEKLTSSWGEMAYTVTGGTGVPLVFLHGTGCDDVDWAETISHLPPGLHIATLEFRGHGQSDVPCGPITIQDLVADLLQLADHINVEHLLLVGHSLGKYPARVVRSRPMGSHASGRRTLPMADG